MEFMIDVVYCELCDYMNNCEYLMYMDCEVIFCFLFGLKGVGGFWKVKKCYVLNVYDMEDKWFVELYLKIMGMEI